VELSDYFWNSVPEKIHDTVKSLYESGVNPDDLPDDGPAKKAPVAPKTAAKPGVVIDLDGGEPAAKLQAQKTPAKKAAKKK
jgi:hypothetical protein